MEKEAARCFRDTSTLQYLKNAGEAASGQLVVLPSSAFSQGFCSTGDVMEVVD
jgi:hypothetical protein